MKHDLVLYSLLIVIYI